MTLSVPLQLELFGHDQVEANHRLDYLRERIERLISQELSARTPVQGVSARESSIVQSHSGPELYDRETGRLIFG